MPPLVSVIILNYNTFDLTWRAVGEILDSGGRDEPLEIIVVDNGSPDGSGLRLQEHLAAEPRVRVVLAGENRGFGAGNNLGAQLAQGKYLLFLNSDCFIRAGGVMQMARFLEETPEAGAVGPALYNPDGTLQPSAGNWPGPWTIFNQAVFLDKLLGRLPWPAEWLKPYYLYNSRSYTRRRTFPWVTGACLMVRRNAFEQAGGFDEAIFMYVDEVDLLYRLRAGGYGVYFLPEVKAVHLLGGGRGEVKNSAWKIRLSTVNLQYFARKHYSRPRRALTTLSLGIMVLSRVIMWGIIWHGLHRHTPNAGEHLAGWRESWAFLRLRGAADGEEGTG